MIDVKKGTGRAKCKICKNIIDKDVMCFQVWGNRFNEQYHAECVGMKVKAYYQAEMEREKAIKEQIEKEHKDDTPAPAVAQ